MWYSLYAVNALQLQQEQEQEHEQISKLISSTPSNFDKNLNMSRWFLMETKTTGLQINHQQYKLKKRYIVNKYWWLIFNKIHNVLVKRKENQLPNI